MKLERDLAPMTLPFSSLIDSPIANTSLRFIALATGKETMYITPSTGSGTPETLPKYFLITGISIPLIDMLPIFSVLSCNLAGGDVGSTTIDLSPTIIFMGCGVKFTILSTLIFTPVNNIKYRYIDFSYI